MNLAGQLGETLQAAMEARSDGRGMPERLSAEVRGYQLCLLGDTRRGGAPGRVTHFG